MTTREALKELKSCGTAQNRKVYARHGVDTDMFGVSYANLGKLKKKIKVDHNLAESLWATRNHDARILATMVADPGLLTSSQLELWVKELSNYPVTDAFSGLAAKTSYTQKKLEKWTRSKKEFVSRAGWNLLTRLAMDDEDLPDSYFESYLEIIERDIHSEKNRVKDAMNYALIAIGTRNPKMQKKAIAAAKRIGKVEVDHGETGCKTPDAVNYIHNAMERKAKRQSKPRSIRR
jgi:3-methyladenine DNA glycosylase AlkD